MTRYTKPYNSPLLRNVLFTSFIVLITTILCIGCSATGLTYKTVKPTISMVTLHGKVDLKTGDVELQGKSKLDVVGVVDNLSPTGKDGSMLIGLWNMFLWFLGITLFVSFGLSLWLKIIPKTLLALAVNLASIGVACLVTSYNRLGLIVTGLLSLASASYLYDLIGKKVLNKVKMTGLGVLYRIIHK